MNVFWFRRDLRLDDNAGLYHALKAGETIPIFIFDSEILTKIDDKKDARVSFIYSQIEKLKGELRKINSDLYVIHDSPKNAFEHLLKSYKIDAVYTNHDYEPYAINRDEEIQNLLNSRQIAFHTYKDQVIFEKSEILSNSNESYTVYTPYSKKWLASLNDFYLKPYPTETYFSNFKKNISFHLPELESIGFLKSTIHIPSKEFELQNLSNYHSTRDFPSLDATSKLGIHLRFGTISVRKLASKMKSINETFVKELIWREFFMQILWHYPHVVSQSFRTKYDLIDWRNNEIEFEKWCQGKTGYPIVDAGMNELNQTGYMHNRVRMIVASFLCKHLLIDWRWGESYFAKKLLDYDLAANNGNWQWAAGTGCDAAPYFRVFNPTEQVKKFDSELKYIRKWVPNFEDLNYPTPMVEHSFARNRALEIYKKGLEKNHP